MSKPSIICIDDGNTANNIYQKFINNNNNIFEPGYYKYYNRNDNSISNVFAVRCGHYPDFSNPEEAAFLPQDYEIDNDEAKIPPSGIIRFNYLRKRFELSKKYKYEFGDTYFHPIAGDFSGNRGKIFIKNLNLSDNNFPSNFIFNKGENKNEYGNIFKEIKNEIIETENKIYDQNNLYSNPVFLYTGNNLFDLVQHTITFSPQNNESYDIFVEKNYTWPIYDFSEHTDISYNLRLNGFYKFFFKEGFTFYGKKYSSMIINKLGFISFTEIITNLEEITYEFQLKKNRINYFSGDQDFTYLSKCYIGFGKSKEVILTFLNIFPDSKTNPINFQIILWESNSFNKNNLFNNTFNRINNYSDNYEKNGTIKFNYNFILNDNFLDNYNKILVGLTNKINYSSNNFKPLYFSDLIEKKSDLLNSNGVPNLKIKLLIKDDNLVDKSKEDLEKLNFDKKNVAETDEIFTTITDILSDNNNETSWKTYYRRNNNNKDFFIKIGEIKINNLNLSKDSKFFLSISTNKDRKFTIEPKLGIVNNYIGSLKTNNLVEYYSDATQNISLKFLNDNEEIDNLNLVEIDNLIKNRKIPFHKEEMIDFFKPLLDQDRKLEFVDLFPTNQSQYIYNNIFDSILYRIQLNKSITFTIKNYNEITTEEIETKKFYNELNIKNRNFKGITINEEKVDDPRYYLKVIFNSKASKNPINNSFQKYIIISEIGLFGPYHLKKNTTGFFKLELQDDKTYLISLVDLIESESVNYGTKIEIFDSTQNTYLVGNEKYDGNLPEVKINSQNVKKNEDEEIFIFLKISSKIDIFYYGILFQEQN